MRKNIQFTLDSLINLIRERSAIVLNQPVSEISTNLRFRELGCKSLHLTTILAQLSEYLGCPIPITLAWKYPTIHSLAQYLVTLLSEKPAGSVQQSSKTEVR